MFKFFRIGKQIKTLFSKKIDESTVENLERIFYEADFGSTLSMELSEMVRSQLKKNPHATVDTILEEIQKKIIDMLHQIPHIQKSGNPYIILIVGVNGNGKTTSVAKLGRWYQDRGKKVLVAAADTFRAAASDQLEIWAERARIDIVKGKPKSDPASVVFDALQAAKSREKDIVIIDTAGRLHTKTDLMRELEKIYRVCSKAQPGSPHETLLVVDATIGQNGIEQAQLFHQFTPLTGLILTKLDGTAKGGGALSIQKNLNIPIRFIGTGEKIEDFQPFEAESFVRSLFDGEVRDVQ
jgi:fused signal recognition particle receptor